MLVIDTRGEAVVVQGRARRRIGRAAVRRNTMIRYRAVLVLDGEGWPVAEIAAALGLKRRRVYEILADLERIRRNRGLAELAA